jgi:hypothetical protein
MSALDPREELAQRLGLDGVPPPVLYVADGRA